MNQSKNAIGNLIARYKAILKQCFVLNAFGSLAIAAVLVTGGATSAFATANANIPLAEKDYFENYESTTKNLYSIEIKKASEDYYDTFTLKSLKDDGTYIDVEYGIVLDNPPTSTRIEYESSSTIDSITSNYIGASVQGTSLSVFGGAIRNNGDIGSIQASFIGNSGKNTDSTVWGGAIYNHSIIGTITGDFVSNSLSATTENSPIRGGAIANESGAEIGLITGNFIDNTATNNTSAQSNTGGAQGGAISNYNATISGISGHFIENSLITQGTDEYAYGGAIYNNLVITLDNYACTIGDITGNFIGNSVTGTAAYSAGGAIYNNGGNASIGNITGDFIGNSVVTTGTNLAAGGAIYTSTTIGTITGNVIGNYVSGPNASGGAIYTSAGLTFANSGSTITFSDNYTNNGTAKDYNAIYASNGVALTFGMTSTGNIVMNDSILGHENGYTVAINGISSSANTFYLNDEINEYGAVAVSNATLELGTYTHTSDSVKTVGSVNFEKLNLSGNSTLKINAAGETITPATNLTIAAGEGLIVTAGTLDVSDNTLTVDAGATAFQTEENGTLAAKASDFGVSVSGNTVASGGTATVAHDLTNDGNLVLEGLALSSLSYADYTTFVTAFTKATGQGTVRFDGVTIQGQPQYLADLVSGTSMAEKVIGGTLGTGKEVVVSGVTGVDPTINNGTLTLTGEADSNAGALSEADITNNSKLYLGKDGVALATINGNLTTAANSTTVANSALTITGVLESAGDIAFAKEATVIGATSFTGGKATFNGISTLGALTNAADTTFNGAATLASIENTAGTLDFKSTVSVTGATNISGGTVSAVNFTNAGGLTIGDGASMTVSETFTTGAGTFAGAGTLNAKTFMVAETADISSGTQNVDTLAFGGDSSSLTISGATLNLTGDSTITAGHAVTISAGALNINSGTLDVSGTTFTVSGGTVAVAENANLVIDSVAVGYDTDTENAVTTAAATISNVTVTNNGTVKIVGLDEATIDYGTAYDNMVTAIKGHFTADSTIEFGDLTINMGSNTLTDVANKSDTSLGGTTVAGGDVATGKTATIAGVTGQGNPTTIESGGTLTLTGKTDAHGGEGTLAEAEITNKGTLTLGSDDVTAKTNAKITNEVNAETTTKGTTTLAEVENSGTFTTGGTTKVTTLTNKGMLSVTGMTTVDSYTADVSATTYVGNSSSAGTLIARNTKLNGSKLVIDPDWTNDASKDVIGNASKSSLGFADATVDGLITVGRNSYLVLGDGTDSELTSAEQAFANAKLTWGKNNISAALFLNEAYELDSTNGGIMVNGLKTSTSLDTATANTAIFADNSLLAVDADSINLSGTAALTAGTITADTGASLLIISKSLTYDTDGKAKVTIAKADTTPSIADGAWGYDQDDTTAIDTSTIYVNSALMKVASVTLNDTDKTYTVTISKVSADEAFGGMMDDDLGTHIQSNDGNNAFLNKALALSTKDAGKGATAIEGATKTAVTSGVGTALGQIGSAGIANIQTRNGSTMTFSENDTRYMLAMTGDGAVLPVNKAQEGLGIWFMPMYKHTSADGFESGNYDYGYDTNLYGATLGADYTFASSLRLGLAFNVGSGESESTGDFDKTDNDFDYFGLTAYGSMNFGKLAVSADLGYTASSNDIDQDNAAGALTADADADLLSAGIKGEYKVGFDSFNMTPYAGVRVNHYNVDSFNTKHQGATTVHTDSSDYTIVEFPVGLTLDTTMQSGGWDITPSLGLGVKFAAGDLDMDQKINYIGADGSAVLSSEVADAVTFQGALGLGINKDAYHINLGYTLDLSDNVESHGLNLNLRYEF